MNPHDPEHEVPRIDRERFPNLAAWHDWDREQHIKHAMQAGMTREQAEWHDRDEQDEG